MKKSSEKAGGNMTTELGQIFIAIAILTLTTLILTPILLWAFDYSWRNQHTL